MKLYFSTLLSLAVLFITPAYAVNLSLEKEAELKSILVSVISSFGIEESKSDEIIITKSENYFSAIIPPISFSNKGAINTELGEVSINAIPLDNDKEWKISFSLPNTIKTYDMNGVEVIITTIGTQKSSIIFDNENGIISKINVSYDDIKVDTTKLKRSIEIANLTVIKDWTRGKGNNVSGPFIYTIKDFDIKTVGSSTFHAKEIVLRSDLKNHDIKSNSSLSKNNLWDNNGISDVFNNLALKYIDNSEDISFEASVKDITLSTQRPSQILNESKISNLDLKIGLNDLKKDTSSVDIKIRHNADATPSLKSSSAPFIPYKTDIDITLENLSKRDILNILLDPELSDRTDRNNTLRSRVAYGLLPALTKSASTIDISKFLIDAHNYGISFEGKVTADDSAKYKSTASLKATLRGLNTIIDILSGSNAAALPPGFEQKIGKITTPLIMLKLIGKQRGSEDIRDYDIEIDKIGTVVLNGTNLSSLTGAQTFSPIPNAGGVTTNPLPY